MSPATSGGSPGAPATGLATLMRTRPFPRTSQVCCALVAGIAAVAPLLLGLALNPPPDAVTDLHHDRGAPDLRPVRLTAAVAAGAALRGPDGAARGHWYPE